MGSNFKYFFHEALVGIRRHIPTTVGTVITMFLSLMMIGVFAVGGSVIDKVMTSVEEQISVTVYLGDEADQAKVDEMKSYIEGLDGVEAVSLTTKDQALEKFKESMASDPDIIAQLGEDNPLPASLDVQLVDSQDVGKIADSIAAATTTVQDEEGNETEGSLLAVICDAPDNPTSSISYGQQTVDRLFSFTNTVRIVGYALIVLLLFITAIFITNTVRLAIMSRRKEIGIERLVGASNSFIRAPFLMESVMHSLLSVVLTIVVLEIIRNAALPGISASLPWLPIDIGLPSFLAIYGVVLVVGVAVGLLGSTFAMRKYLKI